MKVKIYVKETSIEADARELRESQSLAANFAAMLSRVFQSSEPFDDDEDPQDEEAEGET